MYSKAFNVFGILLGAAFGTLNYYAVKAGMIPELLGTLGCVLGFVCAILSIVDWVWLE